MKRISMALALVSLLACSCGNPVNSQDASNVSIDAGQTEETTATNSVAHSGKTDPVCEMEYDSEWTESTVYMNDTIHFCSENCKTAFLARPEKYMAAK